MEIFLINDCEELNRKTTLKTATNIFVDIIDDYGFIVDYTPNGEIRALAFKLAKPNVTVIEQLISTQLIQQIAIQLFQNLEHKKICFIDMKTTLKKLGFRYNSNPNLFDAKIYLTLINHKAMPRFNELDNYCDFITFVESRKKIYDLLVLHRIEPKKSMIYDIVTNSIDAYITMENHKFKFSDIDQSILNTLDTRNNVLQFSYNLTGTITGRTSSKIHPLSRETKKHIIPSHGKMFVNFDYNAAEARVLAHYSGDHNLLDIFKSEQDLHKINAALIFRKDSENAVSNIERMTAKLMFFSIINGVSSKSLADELKKIKIDSNQIKQIRMALQKIYPQAFDWLNSIQEDALTNRCITNLFGRKRWFTDADKDKDRVKRQASNTMIQGTLSDIRFIALQKINKKLPDILAAEFHDAITVELPMVNEMNSIIADISNSMTEFADEYQFKCPLKVNYTLMKHL
jgi:hypothetical protein